MYIHVPPFLETDHNLRSIVDISTSGPDLVKQFIAKESSVPQLSDNTIRIYLILKILFSNDKRISRLRKNFNTIYRM